MTEATTGQLCHAEVVRQGRCPQLIFYSTPQHSSETIATTVSLRFAATLTVPALLRQMKA